MIQILVVFAVLALLVFAVAMVAMALFLLAMACLVGIPLYLVGRHWARQRGMGQSGTRAIDRLRSLYVEGKIDLFEYERRVARLLTFDR